MSLMLLATTAFDRLRARARQFLPDSRPTVPPPESPREQRKRLREEVVARGGVLADIETIGGNCPDQTTQQISDLTSWLARHSNTTHVR